MYWRSSKKQDTANFQPGQASNAYRPPISQSQWRQNKKEQAQRERQMWKIIRKLAGQDPVQQAYAENEIRQLVRTEENWESISRVAYKLAHNDLVKTLLANIAVPVVGLGWLFLAAAAVVRYLFETFPPLIAWGIIILVGYGVFSAYRKYRASLDWQVVGLGRALKIVDSPDGALLLLVVRAARELPGETSAIAANLLDRMRYPLDVWMQYPESLLGLRAAINRKKGVLEAPETVNQREALQLAAIRKVGEIRDVDSIPLLKALTRKNTGDHHELAIYEAARRSLEILEHFKANPHAWYEERESRIDSTPGEVKN